MKPLTITQAYRLYSVMRPHIQFGLTDPIKFTHKMADNIVKAGAHEDFIEMLAILNGVDSDTIVRDLRPEDGVKVFLQGYEVNNLSEMVGFFKGMEQ